MKNKNSLLRTGSQFSICLFLKIFGSPGGKKNRSADIQIPDLQISKSQISKFPDLQIRDLQLPEPRSADLQKSFRNLNIQLDIQPDIRGRNPPRYVARTL